MKRTADYKPYLIIFSSLVIYFLPFCIYGKYTVLPIVDNLDCYYVWNKIAALPKYAWAPPSAIVAEYMNGLPKFTLLNGFSLFFLLNLIFSSFYAVAVYIFLIHSVACFSMYILSAKYLAKEQNYAAIIAALLYGLQSFIYPYGLSLSLLPLLIVVFLRFLKKEQNYKDWILIVVYPFLSNFQSVGIFIVLLWICMSIALIIKKNKNARKLILPVAILIVLYYLNNFPTLNNLLFNSYFVSHRSDFKYHPVSANFLPAMHHGFLFYLKTLFSLKLFILGGFVLFKMFQAKHKQTVLLLTILLIAGFLEFETLLTNNGIVEFLKDHSRLFKMFHFNKIFVFNAVFIAVIYAISLNFLFQLFQKKWLYYLILLGAVSATTFQSLHWKPLLGKPWADIGRPFEGYYSPDLYEKIKTTIALPVNEYKVASFGVHPAVALYNGMYTVDGYINNYPVEYKRKFREIIKDDLDSIHNKIGYREWDFESTGHRCYLQNVDVQVSGQIIDKINPLKSPQIVHWNFDALKKAGCNYIISSVELQSSSVKDMTLINRFENKYYTLFLYKL